MSLPKMVKRKINLDNKLDALLSEAEEREWMVSGRQITATDRQIDRLVYELYDLTDEEIEVIEEATAR